MRIIIKQAGAELSYVMRWVILLNGRVYKSISSLALDDKNSQPIAKFSGTVSLRSLDDDWRSEGWMNAKGETSMPTIETAYSTQIGFKIGFILDTHYPENYSKLDRDRPTSFYTIGSTAIIDQATNKPYMPYGDMTLNHVKFEYKEVE